MNARVSQNSKYFDEALPATVLSYALNGWLIGTFIPAAGYFLAHYFETPPAVPSETDLTNLFLLIGLVCSIVGLAAGAMVGVLVKGLRVIHWLVPILLSPLLGLLWGIVTGGAGGVPMFIVGGIFGALIAAPFGIIGFLLFAAMYETLFHRRRQISPSWQQTVSVSLIVVTLLLIVEIIWILQLKSQ